MTAAALLFGPGAAQDSARAAAAASDLAVVAGVGIVALAAAFLVLWLLLRWSLRQRRELLDRWFAHMARVESLLEEIRDAVRK